MENNLFETLNEENYDIYAGGLFWDIGYWVGRLAATVAEGYEKYGWSDWIY